MSDFYRVHTVTAPPRIVRLAERPKVYGIPGGVYEIPDDELGKYGYGLTPEDALKAHREMLLSRVGALLEDIAKTFREHDGLEATVMEPVDEPASLLGSSNTWTYSESTMISTTCETNTSS
jgi:hypothetical protein